MFRRFTLILLVAASLTLATYTPVAAVDPTPSASAAAAPVFVDPLDPRTGESASRVGAPLLAAIVVIGMGIGAAAATFVYVRVVRRT